MLFQDEPVFVLFVGVKGDGVGLTSESPKRLASKRPSRPKVLLPVARVKLELMAGKVKNEVTNAGLTVPLCEAVARPKPIVP